MAIKVVPTTKSVKKAWGTGTPGYAPGFFAGPRIPTAGGVPNRAGLTGGIYQDPDVIGQQVGDYTPIPTTYTQGGQTINLDPNWQGGGGSDGDGIGKAKLRIEDDPEFIGGLSSLRQWLMGNRNRTRNMLQQAVIGAGFDPRAGASGLGFDLGEYSSDIDPATLALAASNPDSMRAQLETQKANSMGDLVQQLAARNMLRSGASAAGGTQINNAYQAASRQQLAQLLSSLQSTIGDSAQQEAQQRRDWLTRQASIAQRLGLTDWASTIA